MTRLMHSLTRRALFALALVFASTAVLAQGWPSKPIRWVVPFPPGGPADTTARMIGPLLAEELGQPIIIENRPGANSNIGYEHVSKAEPDGHTMLFVVASFVSNPHLMKVEWDPLKDFLPVAQLNQLQIMMVGSPKFGPASLSEVVAYARAKPGALKCAWGGSILLALACEVLKLDGKLDITVVPYKGSAPAMNDLIGGHVDVMIEVMNTAVQQIKGNGVKPIATLNPRRGKEPFADLPTLSEVVPGFELLPWQGVVVPAGTPRAVVERLNAAILKAVASPTVMQRYKETGLEAVPISPAQFAESMRRDYDKYGKLIRDANLKIN